MVGGRSTGGHHCQDMCSCPDPSLGVQVWDSGLHRHRPWTAVHLRALGGTVQLPWDFRRQTTSYHPQSNGMIWRQHRILQDRLISRATATGDSSWMSHLPFVLLGLRTSVHEDSACSPSDLLYGAPLRLPGAMLGNDVSAPAPSTSDFAARLKQIMSSALPMPVAHHGVPPARIDKHLADSTHVFVRLDAVRKPLVPPYEGPFPVLDRSPKTFTVLRREKPVTISIDRLKPAFFLRPDVPGRFPSSTSVPAAASPVAAGPDASVDASVPDLVAPAATVAPTDAEDVIDAHAVTFQRPRPLRSGRIPRPVLRFQA